jgi:hypothetical protein
MVQDAILHYSCYSGKVTMMPRNKFSLELGFLKLELHRQLTTEVVGR